MKPVSGECLTCGELEGEEGECSRSERRCGHHCNCSWVHDCCHWCGAEFGEDGEVAYPNGRKDDEP